jgi:hypothetical protein
VKEPLNTNKTGACTIKLFMAMIITTSPFEASVVVTTGLFPLETEFKNCQKSSELKPRVQNHKTFWA